MVSAGGAFARASSRIRAPLDVSKRRRRIVVEPHETVLVLLAPFLDHEAHFLKCRTPMIVLAEDVDGRLV